MAGDRQAKVGTRALRRSIGVYQTAQAAALAVADALGLGAEGKRQLLDADLCPIATDAYGCVQVLGIRKLVKISLWG